MKYDKLWSGGVSPAAPEMPPFIPGLQLSERFYHEAVRPLLRDLPHAAGLIGAGSDVLGFDTPMSMDHDWGPRLELFVADPARADALLKGLPRTFLGFPTFYDRHDDGSSRLGGGEFHRIETTTVAGFFERYLDFDMGNEIEPEDWLTFPEQKLRTIREGRVFHDDLGFEAARARLAYYPDDLWRYQLACAWERVGQEEHLVGRAGCVGDELGAGIIAARLVRDLMRLGFLMERVYAPYPKWFGSAFARLRCAPELGPLLQAALDARGWEARDAALAVAYESVARMHNGLGLTEPRPAVAAPFHDRPFRVIHLHGGFADALRASIVDPAVRRIAERRPIGGIDLFSDSTDLVSHPQWRPKVRALYE